MEEQVPASELRGRMDRFRERMDRDRPDWEAAAIFGTVNLYYFTGTIPDGMLLVGRDGGETLWVRRSCERALGESLFPDIRPMRSYRDAASATGHIPGTIHLEAGVVTLALRERFCKHFPVREIRPLDDLVLAVRSVKSPYELGLMRRAGDLHRRVLEDCVPGMLREGMTEAEFGTAVYARMVAEGHMGIVRFGSFNTEIEVGQIGFGENSLYPTSFDGPGGSRGVSPAAPVLGSPHRRLRKGDLVFIDNACGIGGYQTDKTMTYLFCGDPPEEAARAQDRCGEIQDTLASLLVPGAIPSEIYGEVTGSLDREFLENFMGFGSRRAGFLGHGTGLQVDEIPVIAEGFGTPLGEGMTIALEPKKGIAGFGMVGIENTFLVTPRGGESITGTGPGLIRVEK